MKDTQHTPGPWVTGGCGDDGWHMILGPKTRFYHAFGEAHTTSIAYISVSDSEAEDLANARLIAAAPTMFDCLAKLEAINADLLNLLTAADRLEELTGENLAVYARTYAALARAAIAKASR